MEQVTIDMPLIDENHKFLMGTEDLRPSEGAMQHMIE